MLRFELATNEPHESAECKVDRMSYGFDRFVVGDLYSELSRTGTESYLQV
ncbi:MAG: hypothetical protein AAFZ38_11405 [Myxococcota bacterium]